MWGLLWKPPPAQQQQQPAHPGGPSRGAGWVARLAWGALLVWLALRKLGLVLVVRNPLPLCAWRVTTGESWDFAWADPGAAAHAMVMYLNKHEEYALDSASLPYARMFSIETYGPLGRQQHGGIRDAEIVARDGPNVFSNVTAAANGEQQGGYRIHITAQGNQNLTNEVAALAPGQQSGHFVLIFRLVDVGDVPHPRAPWAGQARGAPTYPERWGWAPPPRLLVRRTKGQRRGKWREIPACELQHSKASSGSGSGGGGGGGRLARFLDRLHDRLPPLWQMGGFIKPNRRNNMHLQRAFRFNSRDVRTLGSGADLPSLAAALPPTSKGGELWARVAATLPRTPRSLYAAPFIANASAYDVRYVAFTSASRAFPLKSFSTLTDKRIRQHYQNKLRGPHEQWDGKFVVWIGPEGSPVPQQAEEEGALIMAWGTKSSSASEAADGKQGPGSGSASSVSFPALLYTQRLARSQTAGFWDGDGHGDGNAAAAAAAKGFVDFTAAQPAVADVVADACPFSARRKRDGDDDEEDGEEADSDDEDEEEEEEEEEEAQRASGRERVCCGPDAEVPGWCFQPEYLHLRLRQYYPAITFHLSVHEPGSQAPQLRKLAV